MLELVFNRNYVYQTAYHVVWCPKYRRSVLTGAVADSLRLLLTEVCNENGWVILSLEIQPDHIHLFVSIPPSKAVSDAVKKLKGTTARKLFLQHPDLKKQLRDGHLWSPSYYVGTAGKVSAETIRQYIDHNVPSRRESYVASDHTHLPVTTIHLQKH